MGTANSQDKTGAKAVVVLCATSGEDLFAIAGGYLLAGQTDNVTVTVSRPNGLAGEVPAGWRVEAMEIGAGQSGAWSITAYAVCANVN